MTQYVFIYFCMLPKSINTFKNVVNHQESPSAFLGNKYILLLHNYTKATLEFWGLLFGYNYSTSSFCSLWRTAFLQTQLSNVTVEVHRSVIKMKVNICVVAVPSCLEREHRFPPLNWGRLGGMTREYCPVHLLSLGTWSASPSPPKL